MKMYPIEEADYAAGRLNGSVVVYQDKLIEVHSIHPDDQAGAYFDLVVRDYELDREKFIHLRGQPFVFARDWTNGGVNILCPFIELDISPVKLGYVNYGASSYYVVRTPLRRCWRQGMRHNNLRIVGDGNMNIPYHYLSETVFNNFPNYYTCLYKVCVEGYDKFAWDRDWAVGSDLSIYNKGRKVGEIVEGLPVLDQPFTYLQETLDEVCH